MFVLVFEFVDGYYVNVLIKIINDVSDEKECFGKCLIDNECEIGVLFIDIFFYVKGELWCLSISGVDVWFVYWLDIVNIILVSDVVEGEFFYCVSIFG